MTMLVTRTVRGSDYSPAIALSEDKDIFSKGAFRRAFFLWQRSIVIETMAKYLRSHTEEKTAKETVKESLLISLRLFCKPCKRQMVFIASHIFDKRLQTSKDFVTFSPLI